MLPAPGSLVQIRLSPVLGSTADMGLGDRKDSTGTEACLSLAAAQEYVRKWREGIPGRGNGMCKG